MTDRIRVLRILEYVGNRREVEECLSKSIYGTKVLPGYEVRAATLGITADVIGAGEMSPPEVTPLEVTPLTSPWCPRIRENLIRCPRCGVNGWYKHKERHSYKCSKCKLILSGPLTDDTVRKVK
ncbi:hypothetical protein LCGC14_2505930 [marine sediment metagenome]|uniref:Uncharacterized protein n=1 Tax=marine sediment metagenome TaxID=412755 RepID=A0A0F9DCA4_9ZZZZ